MATLKEIAIQIEQLKKEYPQLKKFDSNQNIHYKSMRIYYDYKTHQAKTIGGWSSGMPVPDKKGIWFLIDFHSHQSKAQIHTQPQSPAEELCFQEKKVSFLIKEGIKTKRLSPTLKKILYNAGIIECY